jgi:hypothetical protein
MPTTNYLFIIAFWVGFGVPFYETGSWGRRFGCGLLASFAVQLVAYFNGELPSPDFAGASTDEALAMLGGWEIITLVMTGIGTLIATRRARRNAAARYTRRPRAF